MRYASIDVLRTVAIVLMVVVHFLENLSGQLWLPGDFGAPLFAFLVGISFHLWAQAQDAADRPATDIRKVAVRRGLFLFGLGFAFNIAVWLPDDAFNWDVLTMIGTAMVVLAFVRDLPSEFLAFAAAIAFAVSPFLRMQADYAAHWSDGYFACDRTMPGIAIGYIATGYFPLFPWLVFPLTGLIVGRAVFPAPSDGVPPTVRPAVMWGGGFVLTFVALRACRPFVPELLAAQLLTGWSMFPASTEYVLGALGLTLLAFAGLHEWIDRRNGLARFPRLLAVAATMSRYSLSAYLLHHAVHLWPLWVYGTLVGDEATQFWRMAMPTEWSAALAVACLGVSFVYFRATAHYGWPSVESLMRWLCD